MASKRVKTLALVAAVVTCAGVGYASVAGAHYQRKRHYGWHSHRGGAPYEYTGPTTYAFGMDMVGPAYGCAAPGRYDSEQGEGGVGLGAPSF
jgi:hypothetical protein